MLTGAGDPRARPGEHRSELYRWRRQKPVGSAMTPTRGVVVESVECWMKRVEQASEFAISEVFSPKKPVKLPRRAAHPALDLQTSDQLQDHDDAYTEAQELLTEWLSDKLRLELAGEDGDEPSNVSTPPAKPPPPEFTKYHSFDDLCRHLEQETDDTHTQDFLQQLLEKEVVDSGILEKLRRQPGEGKPRQRDPRVTMEVRHQQVKEKRAQRQQEVEKLKQEKAMKKSALARAQLLLQGENKQRALQTRKEEEEIQREMVKLRKEMNERKRAMEEARRLEWKRKQQERMRERETAQTQLEIQESASEQRKQAKIQERLSRLYADNQRCLQMSFSAWYRLVLESRVRMGKARALADWKLQLRTFRAWRQHTWSHKLERETHKMEMELRDENRKQQAAVESHHKRLLRHCLIEWQLWCRAAKEKRALEAQKEETKKKMAALLEAASSVGGDNQSREDRTEETAQRPKPIRQEVVESHGQTSTLGHKTPPTTGGPKYAWQVTRQHAALTSEELRTHQLQHPGTRAPQRGAPSYGENFENRHHFQQQLIEEQRRQLQEQKGMIQELMENQRLMITRQDAKMATAVTAQLSAPTPAPEATTRREGRPTVEGTAAGRHEAPRRSSFSSASDQRQPSPASTTRRPSSSSTAAHPALRAMEERAAQRAERRRILEEVKRKREEEKLAQLRAAEERKLQMEAAEREAQLQRKREERQQQKLKEEEKQKRLQREKELEKKASIHYQRTLLRFRGLQPWKRLMENSQHNMERAESHRRSALLRDALRSWSQATTQMTTEKNKRAEELRDTILLRRSFRHWLKYKDYLSIQEERAERRYGANLRRKIFTAWLDLTQEERITMWAKQRTAAEHNQRRVLAAGFRTWRALPQLMREQRLKEERREALRKRVAEILPDFRIGDEPKS